MDGPGLAHGTSRALLSCELAAVGYRDVAWHWIEGRSVYLAVIEPPAEPPSPNALSLVAPDRGRRRAWAQQWLCARIAVRLPAQPAFWKGGRRRSYLRLHP